MSEEQIKIWKEVEAKGLEKLENIKKELSAKEGFKEAYKDYYDFVNKLAKTTGLTTGELDRHFIILFVEKRSMERISCTDDEDDLLELYAAVIQVVFNDRVENEEIERLDVADIIDTFGAIVEIIDISVNEKIRYLGTLLGGVPEEDQGSAFDEYDQENGYIEETTQEEIWRSYGDNLDAILQICIKSMRNSYKECLESDLSDLLDYVVFQVEYDREK